MHDDAPDHGAAIVTGNHPLTRQNVSSVAVPIGEIFAVATEYIAAGRIDAADRMVGHVLASHPRQADALHLRGLIEFRRGRMAAAAVCMETAASLGAASAAQLRNLAEVYRVLGRLEEAAPVIMRAIAREPNEAAGYFNLAMIEYDRMRARACEAAVRDALRRNPKLPEAQMKLAQVLLLQGRFAEGWQPYEWRYQIPGAPPLMPPTDRPQWDGAPLGQNRLLLIADQGYGDVIMFGRLIGWAQARCAHVTVASSPEMRAILAQLAPGADIITRWEDGGSYAAYCPLSGLPRLCGLTLDQLPGQVGYLATDPALVRRWQARLDAALPVGRRRVALAWSGRPTHNNDRNRSLLLRQLAPLAARADLAFVSLQKGPAARQCVDWPGPAPLLDLDAEIESFEDSAAILRNCDLLISVDTSLVHLAGAIGTQVWVLLPFAPDWRWLEARETTAWYPSLRLFRQLSPGDWHNVVARISSVL